MLNAVLLQVVMNPADTVKKVVTTAQDVGASLPPEKTEVSITLGQLLVKGGYVMIPIGILMLLAIYVFIERMIIVSRTGKGDRSFMDNIRDMIASGNIDSAKALCRNTRGPQARMVEKGISRLGKPIKEIEEAMEDVGKLELYRLEKNLGILSIVGRVAPMLGFIGTIVGVINIFYKISLTNSVDIAVISDGLYQKMITSAAGLAVGIFAFICYHIIHIMIDKIVNRMETSSVQFIDLLYQPGK
ncbi:MAG: MotA/TolQ/ExbB proton channel family protein [Bacteroidota bacterium]